MSVAPYRGLVFCCGMQHARPEFAVFIAILGILLSIGIPAIYNDRLILGGLCVGLAIALLVWVLVAIRRTRE